MGPRWTEAKAPSDLERTFVSIAANMYGWAHSIGQSTKSIKSRRTLEREAKGKERIMKGLVATFIGIITAGTYPLASPGGTYRGPGQILHGSYSSFRGL